MKRPGLSGVLARSVLVLVIVACLAGPRLRPAYPKTTFSPVAGAVASSGFVYPVMAPRLTSTFGMRIHPIRRFSRQHHGIDLAAPVGAPIRAVSAGTVVFADPYAGYGNLVVIQHAHDMTTHYGHCDKLTVKTGQRIKAGEIIATVGSSGQSTGPHLHFEIRLNGEPRNPESFIPGLADEAEG